MPRRTAPTGESPSPPSRRPDRMNADDDEPPGVPEWVVTYGDMMSLLLTFFIMLVSMSEIIEERRYKEVLASLHDRLGYAAAAPGPPGELSARNAAAPGRPTAGAPAAPAPGRGGTPRPTAPGPRTLLRRERPARPVSAGPAVRFAAGSVDPLDGAALDALAAAVAGKPQTVEVRGFAAASADADRLAFARAKAVMTALTDRGVRPGRFRLRTGGPAASDFQSDEPADRAELWVLDRLAPAPRSGR